MAKGDQKAYGNAVNTQSALQQNVANKAIQNVNSMTPTFQKNFADATTRQNGDYNDLMTGFKNFNTNPDVARGYNDLITSKSSARPVYNDIATTGGLSPIDINAMRNRGNAGARAAYGTGLDEMNRAASMNAGGNIPAAIARMTRQTGENIDNANMGTEANIAGLKQQGKLAGAAGLSTADQIEAAMKEAGLAGLSDADKMHLASLTGGSSLYSATPGLVSTFGNQVLQNSGQGLQGAGLQNDVSNSYLQNLLNKRLIPGDFSQAMGKIGQILSVGGAIPGVVKGFGKGA